MAITCPATLHNAQVKHKQTRFRHNILSKQLAEHRVWQIRTVCEKLRQMHVLLNVSILE
jgi:hypothetical protein